MELLRGHHEALVTVAEALIERETVDGKEVNEILGRFCLGLYCNRISDFHFEKDEPHFKKLLHETDCLLDL